MKLKTWNKVASIGMTIFCIGILGYWGMRVYQVSQLPAPLPLVGVKALQFFSPECLQEDSGFVVNIPTPLSKKFHEQYQVLVEKAQNVSVQGPELEKEKIFISPFCDGSVFVRYSILGENSSRSVVIRKVDGKYIYEKPK